jgi:hypothetical protein
MTKNPHAPFNDAEEKAYYDEIVANERRMLKADNAGAFDPKQHSHVIYTKDATYDP